MDTHEEREVQPASRSTTADEKRPYSQASLPEDVSGKVAPADADLGLRILQDRGDEGGYVLDPAMRRRVLRKIDWHLMPILTYVHHGENKRDGQISGC